VKAGLNSCFATKVASRSARGRGSNSNARRKREAQRLARDTLGEEESGKYSDLRGNGECVSNVPFTAPKSTRCSGPPQLSTQTLPTLHDLPACHFLFAISTRGAPRAVDGRVRLFEPAKPHHRSDQYYPLCVLSGAHGSATGKSHEQRRPATKKREPS
jgi:hypothetical protein